MAEHLRILVVDDDRLMAKTLVDILHIKGYQAEAAYSGPEALTKLKARAFNCMLTDVRMPDMNGVELYQAVKEIWPELPVVLMTAYAADELIEKGLIEGAIAALTKPLDINSLLSFFAALRRERSIVIVDDDLDFCQSLGSILRLRGFTVKEVTDPQRFWESIEPDSQIVLLDMRFNRINGLDILQQLRTQFPRLPVILVTGYREEMYSAIQRALEIKAYTCLYKPLQIEQLLQVLAQVHHRELARLLGQG